MTEVLIVARTQMGPKYCCIGGLSLPDFKSIRLLKDRGQNQPLDAPYEIGEIWELNFREEPDLLPPHTEDVWVQKRKILTRLPKLAQYLEQNIPKIFPADPSYLYDGLVQFEYNRPYVAQPNVPNYSTGFWKTNSKVNKYVDGRGRMRYRLENGRFNAPYKGLAQPIETIPPNTLIRVSLARWWHPDDIPDQEDRCFVQVSGWYL